MDSKNTSKTQGYTDEMIYFLHLSRGAITRVDKDDFDRLNEHKWYCTTSGYAQRDIYAEKRKVLMHREILGAKKGQAVDHINGDKLDNRKANLRLTTQNGNAKNTRVNRTNNKSGFKGVSWNKKYNKWEDYITNNYKHHFLGYFDKKVDAAKAYNQKAKELHGEYARLNTV